MQPTRAPDARRALVTGANGGIGASVALALEAAGLEVVGTARTGGDQETLDLEDHAAIDALVERVRPDVVVHCAAAFPAYARLEAADFAEVERALAVKVTAALRLARAALPWMRRGGTGRFVAIGSAAATLGAAGQAGYATANAALGGLVRSLAVEAGGDGVTANLVVPGLIETPRLLRATAEDARAALVARTPRRRIGQAADVARVVEFLCRVESDFVTGASIPVDGGLGLGLPVGMPFGGLAT